MAHLLEICKTRRFKPKAKHYISIIVAFKPDPLARTKTEVRCSMTQFPVNLNDATTVHKLQGMSKDMLIIASWTTMFQIGNTPSSHVFEL